MRPVTRGLPPATGSRRAALHGAVSRWRSRASRQPGHQAQRFDEVRRHGPHDTPVAQVSSSRTCQARSSRQSPRRCRRSSSASRWSRRSGSSRTSHRPKPSRSSGSTANTPGSSRRAAADTTGLPLLLVELDDGSRIEAVVQDAERRDSGIVESARRTRSSDEVVVTIFSGPAAPIRRDRRAVAYADPRPGGRCLRRRGDHRRRAARSAFPGGLASR